jgi:NAD-dependent SIR2 family protein deacetylase
MNKLTDLRWHTCTKDAPWTDDCGKRGVHPDAVVVGDQTSSSFGGDFQEYHCPHCNVTWEKELPE